MVKFAPRLASALAALPRYDARRPSNLLHMTLLPLGEGIDIDAASRTLDALRLAPFHVVFDRIRGGVLRPSERLRGAVAFQRALVRAVLRQGLILPSYRFDPHVTLAYGNHIVGDVGIDPISWRVEDIRLIESIVGTATHVEHGRYALTPLGGAA